MPALQAAPNTFIVNTDSELAAIPVLGWMVSENGSLGMPVLPFLRKHGILSGEGFQFPDGEVCDPVLGMMFDSVETWRGFVAETKPYVEGKPKGVAGHDGKTAEKPTEKPTTVSGAPRGITNPYPTSPAPAGLVKLGDKTYKTTSFWRFTGDGYDFLFEIAGESPFPKDDRAKKITRDEFFKLRKEELPVRIVNPDDEPELPSGEDADDGMDMV